METLTEKALASGSEMKPEGRDLPSINPELYELVRSDTPLVMDVYEGKVFMRSSCGSKPCKGHYQ